MTLPDALEFRFIGMSCANCTRTSEKGVAKMGGVSTATVNFAAEKPRVESDPQKVSSENIASKVADLGCEAEQVGSPEETGRLRSGVRGMHCASCAATIEKNCWGFKGCPRHGSMPPTKARAKGKAGQALRKPPHLQADRAVLLETDRCVKWPPAG
ncbi:MAG: cation transporter [Thermodesulfobacteriota bacterium]|jgi:copper chaperone CopZ|nr:cation transporter [Thermodesulfobacteriota bacterium]